MEFYTRQSLPQKTFWLSLGILVSSVTCYETIRRRNRKKTTNKGKHTIGDRGERAIIQHLPYQEAFLESLQDACDPDTNPEGYIALCIAENKLVQEFLAQRLMKPGTAITAFSDSCVYEYNSFLGLPIAREAVAYFLERRFLHSRDVGISHNTAPVNATISNDESMQSRVLPNHIVLGSGCASLLSNLFLALAEEGDAVLIPAPYYAAFEKDMKLIAGCLPFPVDMLNPIEGPSERDLEKAALNAEAKGLNVRILLLTNPQNPLGVIYNKNIIYNAISWSRRRNLHTIVDEIYALSVFGTSRINPFESVISVLDNKLGDDVHFLWSLSKDFGASGFRIGVLYSQNKRLLSSFSNLNFFACVSHPMQMIMAEILTDDDFVDAFLQFSRSALRRSYEICSRKLEEMVISYVPAVAGMFVYVDFSSVIPRPLSSDAEDKFARLVEKEARIIMIPGSNLQDRKPGYFRLCFAWVAPEVLEIGMERLSVLVLRIRRGDILIDEI